MKGSLENLTPTLPSIDTTTMSACTSRRACADRNSFRLYKTVNGVAVQGKYIWTEYRCRNVVSSNGKTCTECAIKLPKHKYQSAPKCDHGFVDGPYPSDSKLYGSPFYLIQIKDGWLIYEADETRAKEAQLSASSTMPKKTSATVAAEVAVVPTVAKPKQPRKAKVIKNATETVLATVPMAPVMASVVPMATIDSKFVEQMTAPVKVDDVIVVKVRKIRCEGKDYYFDSVSGKAYAVLTNGVGPYKGRYDPEEETLSKDFPDSDVE